MCVDVDVDVDVCVCVCGWLAGERKGRGEVEVCERLKRGPGPAQAQPFPRGRLPEGSSSKAPPTPREMLGKVHHARR